MADTPAPVTSPDSGSADADVRARVRVAQMTMVFDQTAVAVFAATAFALGLALHLRGDVPDRTLAIWAAVKVLVVVPRIALERLYRRRPRPLSWFTACRVLLLVDGFAWGAAGVWLVPPDNTITTAVIIASLVGVCSVASFVLHVDWPACLSYTVPIMLPCLVGLLLRGDTFGFYGGFGVAIFLALLMRATRRSERIVVEMLTLRYRNEALTTDLSNALDAARRDNQVKNEFVANMSHELRTPLHGILGIAGLLEGPVDAERRADGARVIRRCGEHLLGLIDNILEFSRFGVHGIDLHPQDVAIAVLVDETVAMCAPSAVEKGLLLHTRLSLPPGLQRRADPFRLRQVLFNLVGNAIKFTDRGEVVVAVALDADGALRLQVRDTGIGMSPSTLVRLFEPFVQADSSTRRRFGGTGLGLSITRDIVEKMDGRISCDSAPDVGSTFEVVLPLAPVPAAAAAPVEAPAAAPAALAGTVLLAEDNDVNAMVAQAQLERLGLQVQRARDGHEVLAMLEDSRPDLVLLDCQMPRLDGLEAARRIREIEHERQLPRLRLVALTANAFPEDRDRCFAAGMDDFLSKPYTPAQLHAVLSGLSVSASAG